MLPTVSIITPTKNRESLLPTIATCVLSQQVNWEWLILDDSPLPSDYLIKLSQLDSRVKYLHSKKPISIGEKRNILIEKAKHELIAHFDDDDYYSPTYLINMMHLMVNNNADMIKFSGFYMYAPGSNFLGYLDLNAKTGLHYELIGNSVAYVEFHEKKQIGADFIIFYGFSYVYKKSICANAKFDDINLLDDESFAKRILNNGYNLIATNDAARDCLHLVHPGSTSRCFAGYSIPPFLLNVLFPGYQIQPQI